MHDDPSRETQEIRRDIEETRAELGETMSEVAARANVKKQARAKAQELGGKAREIAPESATEGVQQAQRVAKENPVPLALGGVFLAGVAVGRLISR